MQSVRRFLSRGSVITIQKIIDAAMTLVRDKGYVATTTKEIARLAGQYCPGDF